MTAKCGGCLSCKNPAWKQACQLNRCRMADGLPQIVPKCGKCSNCLHPASKKACTVRQGVLKKVQSKAVAKPRQRLEVVGRCRQHNGRGTHVALQGSVPQEVTESRQVSGSCPGSQQVSKPKSPAEPQQSSQSQQSPQQSSQSQQAPMTHPPCESRQVSHPQEGPEPQQVFAAAGSGATQQEQAAQDKKLQLQLEQAEALARFKQKQVCFV